MKKRMASLMAMLLCSVSVFAHFIVDGIWYEETSTETVKVISKPDTYIKYKGTIVIPEKIECYGRVYSVTRIDNGAFRNCDELVAVTIPSSVKGIGASAFYGCRILRDITMSNGLKCIEEYAFQDCDLYLTAVNIPETVTSIGAFAFNYCYNLTSVTVHWKTPIVINHNVFSNRQNATLYVPAGCIEAYQEYDCWRYFREIKELFTGTVTDEQGVKYTANPDDNTCTVSGYEANNRTTIVIPAMFRDRKVVSIENAAFRDFCGLSAVFIPSSVMSIGDDAFYGCNDLTTVTVQWKTPLPINKNVFSNRTNATLYVPVGSVGIYKETTIWKDFNDIKESFTSITGTLTDHQGVKYTANSDGTCSVSGHQNNYNDSIVIPAIFRGAVVTTIEKSAFKNCSGLNSITVPNSVTSIGEGTFENCSGLTSFTIPNTVTSIEKYTFSGCSGLTAFTIPNTVTNIERCAFFGCGGLTSITVPNTVTNIEKCAFSGCGSLRSIVVESGNVVYDSREDCNAIITTTSNELIAGCTNTIIPNSVTSIGEGAFMGYGGLTSITIPNSVRNIEKDAFNGCSGLTAITIPISVTSIGWGAFEGCWGLTSVISLNTTPPAILSNTFNDKTEKEATLYIPVGSKNAYSTAAFWQDFKDIKEPFNGTITDEQGVKYVVNADGTCIVWGHENNYSDAIVIPEAIQGRTVSEIADNAFLDCSILNCVIIPNSVTSIGNHAFENCSSLSTVFIPRSVTVIGDYAFYGCSNLTDVTTKWVTPLAITNNVFSNHTNATLYVPIGCVEVYRNAEYWKNFKDIKESFSGALTDEQGVKYILNSDGTCIVSGHEDNHSTVIDIPITFYGGIVTAIGDRAFHQCSNLTSITIPSSVKSIGNSAFYQCSNLTSITIPSSVKSIGNLAFYQCPKLTSFTIPSYLKSIGYQAFSYCHGLKSLNIPNSLISIGNEAFSFCSGLNSIIVEAGNSIYDSRENCNAIVRTADNQLLVGCTNTVIPSSVTSIGDWAFSNRSHLTSITIPSSVTSIGSYAFRECYSLISITIPSSVTSIGECAFQSCSLTSITIPNSIMSIGDWAFKCKWLTSVTAQWETPLTISENVFPKRTNSTLYVPVGRKNAYATAAYWQEFKEIKEIDLNAGINEINSNYSNHFQIYDLQGRYVENTPSGLYIMNGKKVVVK